MMRTRLIRFTLGLFVATAFVVLPSHAAPKESDTNKMDGVELRHSAVHVAKGDLTDLVVESQSTLKSFTEGDSPRISQERLAASECVIIFPQVTKAAAFVGGKHGDGVATCKGEKDLWSRIAFVDLRGASFGTQLGVERSSVVMLLNSDKAKERLKQGRMRFEADVSYLLGTEGRKEAISSDKQEDVAIYSDREGAFASASLSGSYVAADDEEMEKFYDEEVNTIFSALSATPSEDSEMVVKDLLVMLPTKKSES